MRCCICGEYINEKNRSEEHIIHNAVGGILKSEGIYCKKCNNRYGSDTDKAFTEIFAPIIDGLDMNFDRKTGKTSYEGIMCDKEGNLYKTRFKNGKVMSMFDEKGNYRKWEQGLYQGISFDFKLDNKAYKMGMAKIAFNFSVYSGISPDKLNRLFDNETKKLVDKPVIIPFMPMTLFDSFIEAQDTDDLYHVLRLFSCQNYLYAYIELFSTFQVYVLLSDNYPEKINKNYCQVINKNNSEKNRDEIMKSLKISDYKEAHIIATQYQIDINQVVADLKEYNDYDGDDITIVFEKIQKMAYDKIRKRSYETDYLEMIDEKYRRADFVTLMREMEIKDQIQFSHEFQYYTCYEEDMVNIKRYKWLVSADNQQYLYPNLLVGVMDIAPSVVKVYTHFKFDMLTNHLKQNIPT